MQFIRIVNGTYNCFFVLVWICRFPLPLDVWEGQRFVIVALPGLFSYFFVFIRKAFTYAKLGASIYENKSKGSMISIAVKRLILCEMKNISV